MIYKSYVFINWWYLDIFERYVSMDLKLIFQYHATNWFLFFLTFLRMNVSKH